MMVYTGHRILKPHFSWNFGTTFRRHATIRQQQTSVGGNTMRVFTNGGFHNVRLPYKCSSRYLEANTSLNEGGNFRRKKWGGPSTNQQTKCIILGIRDPVNKYSGTVHKNTNQLFAQHCRESTHAWGAFTWFAFCNEVFLILFIFLCGSLCRF